MKDAVEVLVADIRGARRFKWVGIAVAWALALAGWLGVLLISNKYETRAQIYVDSTSILRPLLQGLAVNQANEDESQVVRRALLARPNLELVARQTGLIARARSPIEAEKLVQQLGEDIKITGDGKLSLYTITFRDRDAKISYAVVNTLLASFVKDSLGAERADTAGAQAFLRQQLSEYEQRLSESEARLAEFKKANIGLMPDQRGDYFSRLQIETAAADKAAADLAVAVRQRDELRSKLIAEGADVKNAPSATQVQAATQLDARIQQSKRELEELLLRFTDKHPAVLALRETIATLEQRRRTELGYVPQTQGTSASGTAIAIDPVLQSLQISLNNLDNQVAQLQGQYNEAQRRAVELKRLLQTGPEVEAELARLNRDYGVNKTQYEVLLQRFESARLSGKADETGELKFRTIEPPRLPVNPVSPARGILLLSVLVVAALAGFALAVALCYVRPVYTSVRSIVSHLDLTVIGTVGEYLSDSERSAKRRQLVAVSVALSSLLISSVLVVLIREPASTALRSALGME